MVSREPSETEKAIRKASRGDQSLTARGKAIAAMRRDFQAMMTIRTLTMQMKTIKLTSVNLVVQ